MASVRCPDPQTLTDFAEGNLTEESASSITAHLSHCPMCERRVDEITRRGDSVIRRLRQPAAAGQVSTPGMDRLIADAAMLVMERPAVSGNTAGGEASTNTTSSTSAGAVDFDTFMRETRNSGLLTNDEVDDALSSIGSREVQPFALELVQQGKLTMYQAGLLARGKSRGLVLGNYVVLNKLGQGGMGLVFKARHRRMGREVALKVLPSAATKSSDSVRRFRREVQTAAKLIHENVVVAHDADEADGVHFMVMEYIDGANLGQIVKRKGPLSIDQGIDCVMQAARGLQYAHDKGIVHRDIKPQNLLLDSSGTVKVLDLGLARLGGGGLSDNEASTSDLTRSGAVMGTVDYMSPEQALNSKNADFRSDVYSLGCTFYFLLTGRHLYQGETVMEKLVAHREQPLPSLKAARRSATDALDAVFHRMIAKRPEERYTSMTELIGDLEKLASGDFEAIAQLAPEELKLDDTDLHDQPTIASAHGETLGAPLSELTALSELPATDDFSQATEPNLLDTLPPNSLLPATSSGDVASAWGTQPAKQPSNRGVLPWVIGATAGVLVLAAGALAASYGWDSYQRWPAIEARGDLIANGGQGVALIAIPREGYWRPDLINLEKAFQEKNMKTIVATLGGKTAAQMKGEEPWKPDMALERVRAADFDTVVFSGGEQGEFGPDTYGLNVAKNLIQEMQSEHKPVASICNGREVFINSELANHEDLAHSGGCTYYDESKGVVIAPTQNHAHDIAYKVFKHRHKNK